MEKKPFFGSWSYDICFHFILNYEAGFHKPINVKVHPFCRIKQAHATMLGYWNFQISLYAPHFDPNEWCAKNSLFSGKFEPKAF
jgi:hypothetical protein